MTILKQINMDFPAAEAPYPTDHENSIVGYCPYQDRMILSTEIILKNLEAQGMDPDEALEYYSFNIEGSNLGDQTPIYI